eukprot:TRINITY_DN8844_c0_g1_i1.p1 TRINITY_DN8844_c0_g1~~TRINITY_DN8844_c0_g1_i1.p1  ORF type:complete len:678 (-),score=83.18 TRINITY_DN8844_c0_g1_i1:163-2172(-)
MNTFQRQSFQLCSVVSIAKLFTSQVPKNNLKLSSLYFYFQQTKNYCTDDESLPSEIQLQNEDSNAEFLPSEIQLQKEDRILKSSWSKEVDIAILAEKGLVGQIKNTNSLQELNELMIQSEQYVSTQNISQAVQQVVELYKKSNLEQQQSSSSQQQQQKQAYVLQEQEKANTLNGSNGEQSQAYEKNDALQIAKKLTDHLVQHLNMKTVKKMGETQVVKCIQALAYWGPPNDDAAVYAFNQLMERAHSRFLRLRPGAVTTLCTSLAQAKLGDTPRLFRLAKTITERSSEFSPAQCTSILHSFVEIQKYNRNLFRAMTTQVLNRQSDIVKYADSSNVYFSALADMVWCCALTRHYEEDVIDNYMKVLLDNWDVWNVQTCKPSDLYRMLAGLQMLGRFETQFLQQIVNVVVVDDGWRLSNIPTKLLTEILFGLSVQKEMDTENMKRILDTLETQSTDDQLDDEDRQKIYSSLLLFKAKNPTLDPNFGQSIKLACGHAWHSREFKENKGLSHKQLKRYQIVGIVLKLMGYEPFTWRESEDKQLCIELGIQQDGKKVAILVNGLLSYSTQQPYQRSGQLIARRALLESYGWCVIEVPYFVWDRFDNDTYRKTYLSDKLWEVGVSCIPEKLELPVDGHRRKQLRMEKFEQEKMEYQKQLESLPLNRLVKSKWDIW